MSIQINVDNTTVASALNNKRSHKRFIFNTGKKMWFSVWTEMFGLLHLT